MKYMLCFFLFISSCFFYNLDSVYIGDRNFEYCIGLDESQKDDIKKLDCWLSWYKYHSNNQSDHKISYSVRRINQLLGFKY